MFLFYFNIIKNKIFSIILFQKKCVSWIFAYIEVSSFAPLHTLEGRWLIIFWGFSIKEILKTKLYERRYRIRLGDLGIMFSPSCDNGAKIRMLVNPITLWSFDPKQGILNCRQQNKVHNKSQFLLIELCYHCYSCWSPALKLV